jgi:hypothetical protein
MAPEKMAPENGTGKNDWGGKNSNKKNCVRYILLSISICF